MLSHVNDIHGRENWLDLPQELLEIIIQDLDDKSLFQLSQTCRNLHYLALPVWFERHSIKIPADGWIDVYRPTDDWNVYRPMDDWNVYPLPHEHLLRAVRMALFIKGVKNINYDLNRGVRRAPQEFRDLQRLAVRMPAVDTLWLQLLEFECWMLCHLEPAKIVVDGDAWMGQFTGMLDEFLNKGCRKLHLTGGAAVWEFTAKSTIPSDVRTAGLGFRILKALRRLGFVKSSKKEEFTHIGYGNVTIRPATAFEFRKKKHSNTSPGSVPLQEFHLHSGILLHPRFFDWTVSTLQKSQSITTLSLIADMPTNALSNLLSNITLPALHSFDISCSRVVPPNPVDFPCIQSFLTRHPSITSLYLNGVLVPHELDTLEKAILPHLLYLTAHPNYVTWLLGPRGALPRVQMVTISSEYQDYDPFDHNLFDHAIKSVASITQEVILGLRFASKPQVDWLQKHVGAGSEGSVVALLKRVKELKVFCSRHVEFSPRILRGLAGFLSLFPDLERIHFMEFPARLENLMLEQGFFASIASQSPSINTIQVGESTHELSSLRA